MANVTVIARPGKITSDTTVITMQAVIQEQHQLVNTVTDHPVEEGFNPADHSRPEPDQLTMECRISNTPIADSTATQSVRAGEFTVTAVSGATAGAIGATDGVAMAEWAKLKQLRETGAIVKVSTTIGDYDSMAITSISLPRNAKNYDAIAFSISFKRIRVVQNKLTRNVEGPPRVQKKKPAGTKTPKEEDQNNDSVLFRGASSASKSNNSTISGIGKALLRQ